MVKEWCCGHSSGLGGPFVGLFISRCFCPFLFGGRVSIHFVFIFEGLVVESEITHSMKGPKLAWFLWS